MVGSCSTHTESHTSLERDFLLDSLIFTENVPECNFHPGTIADCEHWDGVKRCVGRGGLSIVALDLDARFNFHTGIEATVDGFVATAREPGATPEDVLRNAEGPVD